MFENITFEPGKIEFNDLKNIDASTTIKEMHRQWLLKEDLFLVGYGEEFSINVGWYPEFKRNGSFRIMLAKEYDWVDTIYDKRCRDLITLTEYMEECVALVKTLLKETEEIG